MRRSCFRSQRLITPNLDEAAQLLGGAIRTITRMRTAGKKLFEKYRVPILLKGGHLTSNQAIDLLFDGDKVIEFAAPFVRGVSTHGTGCTYSAAIAAGLARGSRFGKCDPAGQKVCHRRNRATLPVETGLKRRSCPESFP